MLEFHAESSRHSRWVIATRVLASAGVSSAALFWHGPWSLVCVSGACLALGVLVRAWQISWTRVGVVLVWQCAVIAGLYAVRFGVTGIPDGLRVGWRLALVFLPGMIIMRTTPHGDMARLLTVLLPPRLGFVVSTCILFFPALWTETMKTYECQILKGARILPRELVNPLNWPTAVSAVCLPAVMNSLVMARDLAVAAQCRWYGLHNERTVWPGPDGKE